MQQWKQLPEILMDLASQIEKGVKKTTNPNEIDWDSEMKKIDKEFGNEQTSYTDDATL